MNLLVQNTFQIVKLSDFAINYPEIYKRAQELTNRISVEYETAQRVCFKVYGTDTHYVTYDKKTAIWDCDCIYYALFQKICKHIIATMIYVKNRFNYQEVSNFKRKNKTLFDY